MNLSIVWTQKDEEVRDLVASLYKDASGEPIILTWGQVQIFKAIAMKEYPRWYCSCFTRYGKSLVVALAVLTRITTYPEKWSIVSGTTAKAKIIMNYVNEHIFDNEYTASKFRLTTGETAESIKRHRNKSHITFDLGGGKMSELFIATGKQAIGFGSPNVIEDEASLIPDDEQALIQRMIGDNPNDNFLFKIGNPFFRNHFYKSSMDPLYKKIIIDYHHGLLEGRINNAIIDENSKFSFFSVLYECIFPSAESIDDKGWSYLITDEDLKRAIARWDTTVPTGTKRLGNDIARGGRNFNVHTLRGDNYATVLVKNHEGNLMAVAGKNIALMSEHRIADGNVFLDDTGVGGGVTDKMLEEGFHPVAVQLGAKATEMEMRYNPKTKKDEEMPAYANMRAQLYAGRKGLQYWVKHIGALDPQCDWSELTRIRYKKNGSGLTIIESKEDMRKRGEESPDDADALMLTFGDGGVGMKKKFHAPDPAMVLGGRSVDEF